MIVCIKCGNKHSSNSKFCTKCGVALNKADKESVLRNVALEGAATEIVQRYGSAIKQHHVAYSGIDNETGEQLKRGLKSISESNVNSDYAKQNLRQQAGFAAENKYTARENAEHIINKDGISVQNTDLKGSGDYNELFDHIIKDKDGNIIGQEQMKFVGSTPKECLNKLASKKFQKYIDADATITVPKDYYDGIRNEADNEIKKLQEQLNRAKSDNNSSLIQELESKIAKYEKIKTNIKNSNVTTKEAMEARLNPTLSTAKDIGKLSLRAGGQQALYGAAIGGCISLIQNFVAVVKGEKTTDEAICSVVGDTAKSGAVSFATGFVGSVVKGGLQNAKNLSIRALSKTNFAASLVTTAIESGKTLNKYIKGEINGTECLEELGEKGTGQISAAIFALVGQELIPIPVVGALIGSAVGYAISTAYYKQIIGVLKQQNLARKERIRIEQECEEVISLVRQYRKEMNEYLNNYLSNHINTFNNAINQMYKAIELDDIDCFIASSNNITTKLNHEVQFRNFNEFNDFMNSSSSFKL